MSSCFHGGSNECLSDINYLVLGTRVFPGSILFSSYDEIDVQYEVQR